MSALKDWLFGARLGKHYKRKSFNKKKNKVKKKKERAARRRNRT